MPPAPADPTAPRDPRPSVDVIFYVDIHRLTLPYGAVSQNAEFWQKLNEQILDPATYDVLQRNGLRVGEASIADWDYFKSLIEQHPATSTQSVLIGRDSRNVEIPMKDNIPFQNIFHFDQRNTLVGRSFDRSDNLFSISFQPTPRRAGAMRLTVSPVVRSERKRLEFSVLHEERPEIQYVSPEMLLPCNLRLDVPYQSFIVIGPSPEAAWPLSIGHAFLISQGKSELQEHVLFIVPWPRPR
ncbi:MAG: hypothetical protein RMJ35_01840 [Phycisphaerales bacterium]|nr:hypothetical protein [Phycisphaerales bacterium]